MEDKLLNGYTLGREKPFLWSYDEEKIFISKKDKHGIEKDGIGTYIYNNIEENTSLVQTASQLVSVLYNADVLNYNNKKIGMEFWINDMNWGEKLLGCNGNKN